MEKGRIYSKYAMVDYAYYTFGECPDQTLRTTTCVSENLENPHDEVTKVIDGVAYFPVYRVEVTVFGGPSGIEFLSPAAALAEIKRSWEDGYSPRALVVTHFPA